MLASFGRGLVRPASALLSPFRLVWKILIAVALLVVPLVVVVNSFVGTKGDSIAFASTERMGLSLVGPADVLMSGLVASRDSVLAGQGSSANLSADVSSVDVADNQVGPNLDVTNQWSAVRTAVTTAESAAGSPSQVFQTWSDAISDLQGFLVTVADRSNLSLDPRLDSHYLGDALTVQLPAYLAFQGRADGLGTLGTSKPEQDIASGVASQALSAAQSDIAKATSVASDSSVTEPLTSQMQAVANTPKGGVAALAEAVSTMSGAAIPVLDQLLANRTGSDHASQLTDELLAIVLGALALWLVAGILAQAGEATSKLVKTMEVVASGDVTVETDVVGQDEFGLVASHLNEALARIRESLQVISEKTGTVLASSQDLFAVSTEMTGSAESVSDRAAAVTAASEQVNTNVTVVAAAIEEMVASVKEIASNASKASEVATRASGIASQAGDNIAKLEISSVEISNVVSLITSIAEQTNLLALNATIEAARAGEMGKGFAVVANEVKDLAAKTTKATEDISHRIEAIQANTSSATESVTLIRGIIEEINDIQGSIASSVEEQAAAVSEVGRSVAEAASSTSTIVENIAGVADSARGNMAMAERNLGSAEDLSTVSSELQSLIGNLLGQFHFGNGSSSTGTRHLVL